MNSKKKKLAKMETKGTATSKPGLLFVHVPNDDIGWLANFQRQLSVLDDVLKQSNNVLVLYVNKIFLQNWINEAIPDVYPQDLSGPDEDLLTTFVRNFNPLPWQDEKGTMGQQHTQFTNVVWCNHVALHGFLRTFQQMHKYNRATIVHMFGNTTYDSPKLVDFLLRVCFPTTCVCRFDWDVLCDARFCDGESVTSLFKAVRQSVARIQEWVGQRQPQQQFVVSASYCKMEGSCASGDTACMCQQVFQANATRPNPALSSRDGRHMECDSEKLQFLYNVTIERAYESDPKTAVISGAGLCASFGYARMFPPFSCMRTLVMWIDDNILQRLCAAKGGETKLLDDVCVHKCREWKTFLDKFQEKVKGYTVNSYMPSLLRGTLIAMLADKLAHNEEVSTELVRATLDKTIEYYETLARNKQAEGTLLRDYMNTKIPGLNRDEFSSEMALDLTHWVRLRPQWEACINRLRKALVLRHTTVRLGTLEFSVQEQ